MTVATNQTTGAPASKGNRWLLAALVISVAVNVAGVGFILGRSSARSMAGPPALPPTAVMGRFVRDLDDNRRQQLAPLIREHLATLRPGAREFRKARRGLFDAVVREPFDPAILQQALIAAAPKPNSNAAAEQRHLINFLSALTTQERQAFAKHLVRRHPRNRKSHPARPHD